MSNYFFFKNFLRDLQVGAILPSSKYSIRRICKKIDSKKDNVIVEYGPGTGVFIKEILKKMTANSKLILIEKNEHFFNELKKIKDDRIYLFNDCAENVLDILNSCGESHADYIISGIPFSLMKSSQKTQIIHNTNLALAHGGRFLIYQYSNHVKKYLKPFSEIHTNYEILNVPPAFIYEAVKV